MNNIHEHIYFYIDESYKDNFFGVAIVVLIGKASIKITQELLFSISNDLLFKHRNKDSGKIHYADNNLGPRLNVIDVLYQMPISVYLAYKKQDVTSLSKQNMDEMAYKQILPELLKNIATKYRKIFKERPITIHLQFEQLSNKTEKDKLFFTECINRFEFNFDVQVITKENIFTALPDYFLALLRNLILESSTSNWPKNDLELVEGKIGLIIDATSQKRKHYSRGDEIRKFIKGSH